MKVFVNQTTNLIIVMTVMIMITGIDIKFVRIRLYDEIYEATEYSNDLEILIFRGPWTTLIAIVDAVN